MQFLKELTETPGVPGREERVRELILKRTRDLFDQVRVDAMGNLIGLRKATRPPRRGRPRSVMLACHMDQIGFYVKYIDDKGFLRLQQAGGFDTRNLFARRVLVQGRRDLIGVLNPTGRPIHIATEEEKKKVYKVGEFFVDLFMPKKDVEKLVRIGDPVTLWQPMEVVGKVATGQCMDNRVAIWVAVNALRRLKSSPYDIYFVATVQEEVGVRGAQTSAFGINPDIGIAIDVTLACDTPGIPDDESVTRFGAGAAIKIMDSYSISDRELVDEFLAVAKRNRIPHQLEVLPLGGTDAGALQRAAAGRKAITLSVPTRYIHTVTEAVHQDDLRSCVRLLAGWLQQ